MESKLLIVLTIDERAEMADESAGRIVPGVGYNPHRIELFDLDR